MNIIDLSAMIKAIHSEKYNNNLKDDSFINQKNKTVNGCTKLVHYTPIHRIELIERGNTTHPINEC